ncbi:hypothetical protein [Cellulomonas sp. P5_E12]
MSPPDSLRRRYLAIHLVLLAVAGVVLLVANRHQWFFGDEWEFFVNRGLVGARFDVWRPHNEHWSTLPILVLTFLRDTVGLATYWPYVVVLVALHLGLAHVLWRVSIRSGAHPAIATAGAAVFSVLGAGSENLLWAFQIGFVGSLLLGWSAVLVGDREGRLGWRDSAVATLLVGALLCSGIGVPTVVAAGVAVLIRSRSWVRAVIVAGVPAVVFAVWFRLIGAVNPSPPTPERDLQAHVSGLAHGIAALLRSVTGGPTIAVLAVLLAVGAWAAVTGFRAAKGEPVARGAAAALGGVAGAATFVVIVEQGRADLMASRYAYVAVAFALPLVLVAVSALPARRWVTATAVTAIALVGAHNVVLLFSHAAAEAEREATARSVVLAGARLALDGDTFLTENPEPELNPDITLDSLRRFVRDAGLPADATPVGTSTALRNLDVVVGAQVLDGVQPTPPTDAKSVGAPPAADPADPGAVCWTAIAGQPARVIVAAESSPLALRFLPTSAKSFDLVVQNDGVRSPARPFPLSAEHDTVITSGLPAGSVLQVHVPPGAVLCEVS